MEVASPSSRSPEAMRGTPLRVALRDLGAQPDTPLAGSAVFARSVPVPAESAVFVGPPVDSTEGDDDEPAPRALRPEQLAHWLDGRG